MQHSYTYSVMPEGEKILDCQYCIGGDNPPSLVGIGLTYLPPPTGSVITGILFNLSIYCNGLSTSDINYKYLTVIKSIIIFPMSQDQIIIINCVDLFKYRSPYYCIKTILLY